MDIKAPEKKTYIYPTRFDKKMYDQIRVLAKKNKVSISLVIRSLIEAGLKIV